MNDLDFLQPDLSSIKHSIRDIDDSYSHEWDILAELCQNSVDAINATDGDREGAVTIEVNSQRRLIRVKDNGIGIESQALPSLLRPFSSNKINNPETIGEKGVGLTFVMFSGDKFEIRTSQDGKDGVIGSVNGAYGWKKSPSHDPLRLEIEESKDVEQGTEITISEIDDCAVFDLTFEQLKYLIRTKTSIGSTMPIWGNTRNFSIELLFTDTNGEYFHEPNLPFSYALPHECLPAQSIVDFDDFIRYASDAGKTDFDKRSMLRNKVIIRKGEFVHANSRKIKYTMTFVPQRRTWDTLAQNYSLATDAQLAEDDWREQHSYLLPSGGIFTSVKGMPTGISVSSPVTGNAGYWSNIFILFEDPNLKFDIGRKALYGRQTAMIKEFARRVFNEITRDVVKYVAGDAPLSSDWSRDEVLAEIESLPNIQFSKTTFLKSPKDQEASVAGIFYECIGNGTITDLVPITSAYKDRYDLVAKWGRKTVFIEFKSHLRNITKDFNDARKMFDEMDCIVCWDVSETDAQEVQNRLALYVEPIESNPLDTDGNVFPNASHKLVLNGYTKPVYVIDLKKVLEHNQ